MDVLRRADVHPARGLGGNEHARMSGQLPGQNQLLDIAAGQIFHGRLQPRGFDAKGPHQIPGMLLDGLEVQENAAAERRPIMILQNHIIRYAEILDHAIVHPLLRDVGETDLIHLRRRQMRNILSIHDHLAAAHRLQARDSLGQGALAIARHARHAQNLIVAHLEVDILENGETSLVADIHFFQLQTHLARGQGFLVPLKDDFPPDHHAGQLPFAGLRCLHRANDLAVPQHCHPVGQCENLIHFM